MQPSRSQTTSSTVGNGGVSRLFYSSYFHRLVTSDAMSRLPCEKLTRRPKFAPVEVDVLVDEVARNASVLFEKYGRQAVGMTEKKREAWTTISEKVDMVSKHKRTWSECRSKWTYYQSDTKKRVNMKHRLAEIKNASSDEPACKRLQLTPNEQKVLAVINTYFTGQSRNDKSFASTEPNNCEDQCTVTAMLNSFVGDSYKNDDHPIAIKTEPDGSDVEIDEDPVPSNAGAETEVVPHDLDIISSMSPISENFHNTMLAMPKLIRGKINDADSKSVSVVPSNINSPIYTTLPALQMPPLATGATISSGDVSRPDTNSTKLPHRPSTVPIVSADYLKLSGRNFSKTLPGIEEERLNTEKERLEIEKMRLDVEQHRLRVEEERLLLERNRFELEKQRATRPHMPVMFVPDHYI